MVNVLLEHSNAMLQETVLDTTSCVMANAMGETKNVETNALVLIMDHSGKGNAMKMEKLNVYPVETHAMGSVMQGCLNVEINVILIDTSDMDTENAMESV